MTVLPFAYNHQLIFQTMKRYIFVLFTLLALTVFSGCKKDKGEPPVLPPAGSMTMDFSNFEVKTKDGSLPSGVKANPITNWQFAAGTALIWKAIIATTLAVPVYSFQLVHQNNTPVYLDDNTWQWKYSVSLLNVTYSARLTGQILADNVRWKMFISREGAGGFEEFLWFEGISEKDGSQGQWTFYESHLEKVPVLQIDWAVTGNKVGQVKYTYIKTGNPFKDSYIKFGLVTGELDAFYEIHIYNTTSLQFYDVDVQWSTTNHNGRVRCQAQFGDTDWHCWDSHFSNVSCTKD